MVNKCCVPNCHGNYDRNNTVSVFNFPSDLSLKQKWIHAIKRDHFEPTRHSKVCELHFQPHEIMRTTSFRCEDGQEITLPLKSPQLVPGSVPSLLPNCPAYLNLTKTFRDSPQEKRQRRECDNLRAAIQESLERFEATKTLTNFSTLEDLKVKVNNFGVCERWTLLIKELTVSFLEIKFTPAPSICCSVVIDNELCVKVYFHGKYLQHINNKPVPQCISNMEEIRDILQSLEKYIHPSMEESNAVSTLALVSDILLNIDVSDSPIEHSVNFILEQVKLLQSKRKSYSASFLIFCCLMYSISPHSYKFIRSSNYLTIPHPCTIRKVCSSFGFGPQAEQSDEMFLMYIKSKFSNYMCNEYVVVMMDEIHIKPYLDYKGGNVVGCAMNSDELTSSAHVFMVSSLLSNFKEVAHVLPVKTMCAENLHSVLRKLILGLEKIGFKVICITSDNNSINRKCMQLFSEKRELKCVYQHPADKSRPLFFVFDSVHVLKCIRNNWLSTRNVNCEMYYPSFDQENHDLNLVAAFQTIRKLHELESGHIVRYGHGLTWKALCPSILERQNVKLVLQIFNENVIEGLKVLGQKNNLLHSDSTAKYLEIILKWWYIVNVKTPKKGLRFNNVFMMPMSSFETDERVNYLRNFLEWCRRWKNKNLHGCLSNETMTALIVTTEGLLQLHSYCIDQLKFSYFLPGKVQTDDLESRFGKYRQLAGGQYNISLRQLYEVEQKLRIQNSIGLKIKSSSLGDIEITDLTEKCPELHMLETDVTEFVNRIEISDADIIKCNESLPILFYLAGYCCHQILKKLKCEHCKSILTVDEPENEDGVYDSIKEKSRGRLLYPHHNTVQIVLYNYIIVSKLCSDVEKDFLKVQNQRELVYRLTGIFLVLHEVSLDSESCVKGHSLAKVCEMIVWTSTNIFLNNYCKEKNSNARHVACMRKKKILMSA